MKRIDAWKSKLTLDHRLIITKNSGWVRIIRVLGGQWRYETSSGIDLYFNTIDEAIAQATKRLKAGSG